MVLQSQLRRNGELRFDTQPCARHVDLWSVKQINQKKHADLCRRLNTPEFNKECNTCLTLLFIHTTEIHVQRTTMASVLMCRCKYACDYSRILCVVVNFPQVTWNEAGCSRCRSFRRSTVCFSWIKEDLWWPSDTHLCQLGTFGKALWGHAASF